MTPMASCVIQSLTATALGTSYCRLPLPDSALNVVRHQSFMSAGFLSFNQMATTQQTHMRSACSNSRPETRGLYIVLSVT